MKDDDEEEENTFGVQRYPCMPSLVALQQMRNRLHLAFLGRKLMKWTALATGRELRRLAAELYEVYEGFGEDMRNAFILLARSRYFYPQLNHIVTEDIAKRAAVMVQQSTKQVSSVKIVQFEIIETEYPPYEHLGIEKGGQTILETKKAWLELLKRIIMMMQLRASFLMVEIANKNATKKWNVLSKLVIPRVKMSCRYITSELEEIEREDNFRLKRFKELKIKKNKEKSEKKDSCTCQDFKTGDGVELSCMDSNKNKSNIQMEVPENVCCNTDVDIVSRPDIKPFAKNVNESFQRGTDSKRDNRYILSASNSTEVQEDDKDTCICPSPSTDIKPDVQSHIGAEGDNKKYGNIFPPCTEIAETSCSCQSLNVKQSETPSKTCSCESLKLTNIEECDCTSEELKHSIVKESKVCFSDRKTQTDNLKYSYSCPTSQKEYESHLSTRAAVTFNDEKKDIRGKSTCICQPTKPHKVLFGEKATQTRSLTDFVCSCNKLPEEPHLKDKKIDRRNDYIFSACKKRIKDGRSETPKSNINDSEESGICCTKSSSGEGSLKLTKSDQRKYNKPIFASKSDKSCKPVKSQTKVSFKDIGVQTGPQSKPCKTSGSLLSKENMGSSVKVGEFKRTFKETIKIIKKPDKDGNIREDHRKQTVKTEKKVIGNPIASKRSPKQVLKTPSTASSGFKTAQNPCGKECSICTISQPISLTSVDLSQPVTEKESLIQEVNFNLGDKSFKCCNKGVDSSVSHVKSCESIKSASSSCASDRSIPKSCKIKIVAKSDEDSTLKDGNQNKVELTPSIFNIIKSFLFGLSKSDSKKSDEAKQEKTDKTKNKTSVCPFSSKVVKPEPSKASCCCENIRKNMILKQQTEPCKCSSNKEIFQPAAKSSCPCDKSRDMLKFDFESNRSCNKTRSSPIIDRSTCICDNNIQENPPLLSRMDGTKSRGCQYQKNKTCCELKAEKESSQCSCSRVQESSDTSLCRRNFKNEKYKDEENKCCKSESEQSNESCEKRETQKCSCKSYSTMSDSRKKYPKCNYQSSTTSISTARDDTKKSLRFGDSYPTKTKESCNRSLQKKSDISSKLCCSKPDHFPCYSTTQTQDSVCSKCSIAKVDASTSTRRSDKYDVRPLKLLMEIKKHDCLSKSDTAITKTSLNKKSDSCKPVKRCCSYNDNDVRSKW